MHILYSFKPNVIIIWICTLAICINRVDLYLLGTQRFMCNVYCVVKQQSKMGNINALAYKILWDPRIHRPCYNEAKYFNYCFII